MYIQIKNRVIIRSSQAIASLGLQAMVTWATHNPKYICQQLASFPVNTHTHTYVGGYKGDDISRVKQFSKRSEVGELYICIVQLANYQIKTTDIYIYIYLLLMINGSVSFVCSKPNHHCAPAHYLLIAICMQHH